MYTLDSLKSNSTQLVDAECGTVQESFQQFGKKVVETIKRIKKHLKVWEIYKIQRPKQESVSRPPMFWSGPGWCH